MTDWWELGSICPSPSRISSFCRTLQAAALFVSPNAEQRNFFYGVNFEFSNTTPKSHRQGLGWKRPIVGIRNADYEFIVNPIVDVGFGKYGEADFAPAARVARKLGPDLFVGLEYYADFGEIGNFARLADQQHTLFAVTDFKVGVFDVDFGVGYGLTPASDRFVVKTIVGYAFPVPGGKPDATERAGTSGPVNPMSRSSARTLFNPEELAHLPLHGWRCAATFSNKSCQYPRGTS